MWESRERGKISGTPDELAKLLRATNGDFETFLKELERHNFADVTNCNNEVTLINRRMYREQKIRDNTRLRVSKFRSNAKCNAPVTELSSSSSSNKEIYKEKKDVFGEFKNVKLTDEEYQKLNTEFGETGTKQRIENLSEYIASKGKKYLSHYATILTWERKNNPKKETKRKTPEWF